MLSRACCVLRVLLMRRCKTQNKSFMGMKKPSYGFSIAPARLYVLGMPPRGYFPDFATLIPQSTRHGARPGPKLAPWFQACSLPAPQPRPREKTRGAEEQEMHMSKKSSFHTCYKVPLREEARGVAQERNEKHPA